MEIKGSKSDSTMPHSPRCQRQKNDARQRPPEDLHVQRLPRAIGLPSHVAALDGQSRWRYAQALNYSRHHVFPFHLPDSGAMDAWSRAMYWHPSTFYASAFTTAVHRDLLDRKVARSKSPQVTASLRKCIESLRHELSLPNADLHAALVTVGLLTTHHLTERKMDAMYGSAPLCLEPVVHRDVKWQVIQQLQPDGAHVNMMVGLIKKLGGLNKLQVLGLANTTAYVELQHASKHAQHPRLESLWIYDSAWLPPSIFLPSTGDEHDSSTKPGSGFFVSAFAGLTPAALATLTRLAAMNQGLQTLMDTNRLTSGNANEVGGIWLARNALQHDLLSLPAWEELTLQDQALADKTIYSACILAAVIYSNAALFAMPYHSGWHTSLSRKLLSGLKGASWPAATHGVHLWVLMIGGIAAAQSEHRPFYERELSELLDKMGRPSWTAAERILQGFLWSSKACRHGAAALWQAI